jgi:putative membrane protein
MALKQLFFCMAVIALAAGVMTSCMAVNPESHGHAQSENFVRRAAMENHFQIMAGEIALKKSNNRKIRKFSREMIETHTGAKEEMKMAVDVSNVSGGHTAGELNATYREMLDELRNSSGRDFDRRYLSMQKEVHSDAVRLFRNYRDHGRSMALRQFAIDTLPVLESHERKIYNMTL